MLATQNNDSFGTKTPCRNHGTLTDSTITDNDGC